MKIRFTCNGEIIDAADYGDIVTQMRINAPHAMAADNHEYMIGYAQRAVALTNEDIRATNEQEFIRDLVRLRHIEIVNQ
ncbi:hypothetical protein SAMN05443429_11242 [Cruoricaptor ignavus]|uniref:Uncharacterized protein n=1 Tax=Cruoricaptor ignavus TaxID=1118202 RepID=A0A1M6HF19_9FLAO|nr:hypothetical protein [Cruoricaptor ignavus]SHJ20820.1 hypothetical protein SAMN05443429_11242 [Cruoricaptor ignavus]